jgi:predicted enzyme related to lactoylglutathione lyase
LEAAATTLPRDYNFVRPIADLLSSNPPHAKARPIERPARVPIEKTTRVPVEKVTPAPVEKMAPTPEKPATRAPRLPVQHQVVWFDIPVRDIDRAMRFYSAVLGKPLKKEQAGPGTAVVLLPHDEGSVGGSLVQNMDARPSDSGPLLYLNTQDRLEEVLIAVERHGGKVLAETHSIEPFGFRAIVLDSEGNRIALHSM